MQSVGLKDSMELLAGLICFFGLALVGLGILAFSAAYSRSRVAVVVWALVAAIPMALECVLLTAFAGIGSATSGSRAGYRLVTVVFWVMAVGFVSYFPLALFRLSRRKPAHEKHTNAS